MPRWLTSISAQLFHRISDVSLFLYNTYLHTYIHHTYIDMYVYTYTHICTYVRIYIYTHMHNIIHIQNVQLKSGPLTKP